MATTTTLSGWSAGELCEKHDLAYCAMCKDQAGIRSTADGWAYSNDCTVRAFAAITGVEYDDAIEIFAAAGNRLGKGNTADAVADTFRSLGFTVTTVTRSLGYDGAIAASRTGRRFYVSANKGGRSGHAWAIIDGNEVNGWRPPFRFHLYEVTA